MTSYTVLYKPMTSGQNSASGAPQGWQALPKPYEAASNLAAVRAAAADTQKAGFYAAIPVRSFEIVTIEIETNPRVKIVKGQA